MALCSFIFISGSILSYECPKAIALVLVGPSIFRISMVWQWAWFIWEKKGTQVRPGGNTLHNTPKHQKMLGHFLIQAASTLSMIAASAVACARARVWDVSPLLSISSVRRLALRENMADNTVVFGFFRLP